MFINSRAEMKNKTSYEENNISQVARHFLCTFFTLKIFNHLAGIADDIVEITDEKHDDHVEDHFEYAEEIPDYNIGKRANPPLFAEFTDNAAYRKNI